MKHPNVYVYEYTRCVHCIANLVLLCKNTIDDIIKSSFILRGQFYWLASLTYL